MTTYYVDATGGNDGDPGTTEGTAWQTIGKVNGSAFNAGDSVLFKRGEIWVGTTLTIPSSGAVGNPITFADYGTGALPIIDGNDAVQCISANTRNYITFENIRCIQGLDYGWIIVSSHDYTFVNCEGDGCGNAAIDIDTGTYNVIITGGVFTASYERVPGTTGGGIVVGDDCHDVAISSVECSGMVDTSRHGISVHNHVATRYPYNVSIKNSYVHDNAGAGINLLKQDATADTDRNILIEYSRSSINRFGINISQSGAAYVNGVTMQYCLIEHCTLRLLDIRSDNVTISRTVTIHSANVTIPNYVLDAQNVSLLNCVFYATAAMTAFAYMVRVEGARTQNFVMKNCIIETESTNPYMVYIVAATGVIGMDIDYNLYGHDMAPFAKWNWLGAGWVIYAAWQAASGQDANSPAPADPAFVDAAHDKFKLQHKSPALNVGTDVGMPHWGTAPDCGRWEMRWAWTPQMQTPRFVTT